jgi:hypothetical protein
MLRNAPVMRSGYAGSCKRHALLGVAMLRYAGATLCRVMLRLCIDMRGYAKLCNGYANYTLV